MEMSGELRMKVIRSAESWQFFAFIFAAVYALEVVLLENVSWLWLRLLTQTMGFGGTFYVVMLNRWVRNSLVRLLTIIKESETYTA